MSSISKEEIYSNLAMASDIVEGTTHLSSKGDVINDEIQFNYSKDELDVSGYLSINYKSQLAGSFAYCIGEDVCFDHEILETGHSRVTDASSSDIQLNYVFRDNQLIEVSYFSSTNKKLPLHRLILKSDLPILQLA